MWPWEWPDEEFIFLIYFVINLGCWGIYFKDGCVLSGYGRVEGNSLGEQMGGSGRVGTFRRFPTLAWPRMTSHSPPATFSLGLSHMVQ